MISALSIRNFKAFGKVDVPFGRLTLLTGLNSSGKSTVLQALALLRQGIDASGGIFAGEGSIGGLPLNGEYVQLGLGRDVLHEQYFGEVPRIEFAILLKDYSPAAIELEYESEKDVLRVVGSGFHSSVWSESNVGLKAAGFQYLRADRINPATTYSSSYEMAVRRGSLGSRGEFAVDYLRHHQDDLVDLHLCHPQGESRRLLAQVDAWLGEICPGVRVSPAAIENTELVRLSIQFASKGSPVSGQRRPTNVGFGLTYLLPIIIACLTARPGAMLLLENPEAHIHPRGQSAMARLAGLAATRAQVIVETHSDHVLNGVRLAVKRRFLSPDDVVLHYFSRRDGRAIHMATPRINGDGMLSEWPTGFFDEWDDAIESLLR